MRLLEGMNNPIKASHTILHSERVIYYEHHSVITRFDIALLTRNRFIQVYK